MLDINARLKNAREEKRLSLSDLSKITGIAKSTLQRYETGSTRKIPMDSISNIEQKLGLPLGYLMGWTEKPTPTKEEKSTNYDGRKENTVVFHRNGQTTELKLTDKKMDMFVKMIEAFRDNDSDL